MRLLITALVIMFVTLFFVFWRPRGIHEAWFTVAGAAAALLVGLITWADVVAVAHETGHVLLFLIGVLIIGFSADRAGVFGWIATRTALAAKGSGPLLYAGVYLLGALVTTFFSLDTTAVILAPIALSLARVLGVPGIPFVFAAIYSANTASLILPMSNLTNLIVWARFDIPFWQFAGVMLIPGLVVMAVNLALLIWLFRREIPRRYDVDRLRVAPEFPPSEALDAAGEPARPAGFRFTVWALAVILASIGLSPVWGIDLSVIALIGALVLVVHGLFVGRHLDVGSLGKGIAWGIVPFVFALFLVMRAVGRAGLQDWISGLIVHSGAGETFTHLLGIATVAALGSNVINNLPMILLAADSFVVPVATGDVTMLGVYAALIGTNVGPNLTIYGSLATILTLAIVAHEGVRVSGWRFLKIGLFCVPFLIVSAVLGLWVHVLIT